MFNVIKYMIEIWLCFYSAFSLFKSLFYLILYVFVRLFPEERNNFWRSNCLKNSFIAPRQFLVENVWGLSNSCRPSVSVCVSVTCIRGSESIGRIYFIFTMNVTSNKVHAKLDNGQLTSVWCYQIYDKFIQYRRCK